MAPRIGPSRPAKAETKRAPKKPVIIAPQGQKGMTFTTLGHGPYPRPDLPCSGYLLQGPGVNIWVDAGGGTLAALQKYITLDKLTMVWVSHLHADHFSDMPLLYYAFAFSDPPLPKIPVLGPPGWARRVEDFVRSASEHSMADVFDVVELSDAAAFAIGPLRLEARAVEHGVPSFGLLAVSGTSRLAYTGDSGPCDALVELAGAADVLVHEIGADEIEIPSVHCTPEDAALTARHAKARRLVLTHPAVTLADAAAVERARALYDGPVEMTNPGSVITL